MIEVCDHPADERVESKTKWMWWCCLCGRFFWGLKTESPGVDIYGRPA